MFEEKYVDHGRLPGISSVLHCVLCSSADILVGDLLLGHHHGDVARRGLRRR